MVSSDTLPQRISTSVVEKIRDIRREISVAGMTPPTFSVIIDFLLESQPRHVIVESLKAMLQPSGDHIRHTIAQVKKRRQ